MEDNVLKRAAEDITLIKQVIDRTACSLLSFSRVFIWWGFLTLFFLLISTSILVIPKLYYFYISLPFLNILMDILVLLSIVLTYYKVGNAANPFGFSKYLMKIWICILMLPMIKSLIFNILNLSAPLLFEYNMFYGDAWRYIIYSMGFFCIYLFTGYKFPGIFSLLFIIIGFTFMLPVEQLSRDFWINNGLYNTMTIILLNFLGFLLPLSLITLGFYLKLKKPEVN